MPPRTKAPRTKGGRSGPSIPEAQRGERGELLQVRVKRGTVAQLEALAKRLGYNKGELVEAAIDMIDVPEA